ASFDDEGVVADFINLRSTVNVSPIPQSRIHSILPATQILRDSTLAVQTRSKVNKSSGAHAFEELLQFKTQQVWILVDLPFRKKVIVTKWLYRNKKDERGIIVRHKARLVAPRHIQEEGIDYDEVFAPVARIEAIKIFLAFASYMGFIVYQMDVKSAFLYGKINKEVYVSQPSGFIDPKFPNKVYKVVKALRGLIDKTLFIKKDKKDIKLVQVYVDGIIFGSTKKSWCDEFEALMKSRFQMNSIGELTLFLGLQVKQRENGIFISQDKYVAEILKKFDFMSVKTASTLIETKKPLVTPKSSHLQAVKRIFRHHFIRDAYEKKLIQVLKIHTDENVADLLTKAFDVSRHKVSTVRPKLNTARKKAKTESNIEESANYAMNKGRLTDKFKVLNVKAKGVSAAGETLNAATLTISTEAKMGMRKFFKCWFHHHTTNGHQFIMSNRHQELASPKANGFCKELASPKQTALGKDLSNPLMADSFPKTIWLSMHHVIAMKYWLSQSKRILNVKDAKVSNEFKFIKEQIRE
nr:copia protein [Tanacetum cinerariifolium]